MGYYMHEITTINKRITIIAELSRKLRIGLQAHQYMYLQNFI